MPPRGGIFRGRRNNILVPNEEKPKNFKNAWRKLLGYASGYKFEIVVVIILSILGSAVAIISPKISGLAITHLSGGLFGETYTIDFDYIFRILGTLLALYSVSAVASCLGNHIMTTITVRITYRLRENISKKISKLSMSYLHKTSHGDILSRMTNDVDTLSSTFTQSINQIITSVIMVVGTLYMMFTISWQMALTVLGILPISAIFVLIIIQKSQKYFKEYQDYLGKVNGHIEEMYSGHVTVRAFNAEKQAEVEFDKFNNGMYTSAWKSQFLSGFMSPIMTLISNLEYVAVCILGGYLAVMRLLTIGDISSFIAYSSQFTQPLIQLAGISNALQQTAAAAERVFEFLHGEEEPEDSKNCAQMEKPLKGDIEFKDVSFGYDNNKDNLVIKNLSVKIKSGQSVAIVGTTGAGKTTLVNLLLRFYEINNGEILIDGNNIKNFKMSDLRSQFGIVTQEPWLYGGTVLENIRYGNQSATDEQVFEAAQLVGANHFIDTLPDGYNTVIDETASNISEGQKQLLTIARAVISDPPILILDEATSSVDTRTENHIQNAISSILNGRTSFVIAHRLSTIQNADLILVMDKGQIAEKGCHSELLQLKGIYYNLYASQFEPAN